MLRLPYTSFSLWNAAAIYVMLRFCLLSFVAYRNFHSSAFSGIFWHFSGHFAQCLVYAFLSRYILHFAGFIYVLFKVYSQNNETRLLASSCLSFRPPVWNNSAPTARIFMKFCIQVFFANLSRKFELYPYAG